MIALGDRQDAANIRHSKLSIMSSELPSLSVVILIKLPNLKTLGYDLSIDVGEVKCIYPKSVW